MTQKKTIFEYQLECSEHPTKFDWKLINRDYNTSIFEKKKMIEHTNIKKIYGFIKNNLGIAYDGIPRYEAVPFKTELDQMIKYKECYNKKMKKFQTAFQLPKHKWGRVQPYNHTSLSVYHRPTRHALCEDIYIDIDMVNAQPTIIFEICKKQHISVPALQQYVENTQTIREAIMQHHGVSKEVAKNLPISIMFGGSYSGWMKEFNVVQNDNIKLKEIVELENDLNRIMEIVYLSNKDTIEKTVLKQDPDKWKTFHEKKRGVMALWCQSVERMFQETSISYLVNHKYFNIEDIVPCQDGFMILKELWYEGILEDCARAIFDKFDITLQYVMKPFDEAIEIPLYGCDKTFHEWVDLLSAKKLADRFLHHWKKFVILENKTLFVYREEDGVGRWFDETTDKPKLCLYISEDLFHILESELVTAFELSETELNTLLKKLRDMTCHTGAFKDIVRLMLPNVRHSSGLFNKKDFLLGFENGVVDLRTSVFRPYEYDDYMTITTKYNYVQVDYTDSTNVELRTELNNIIESIQPEIELRTLYLQILASGLDGRPYQKLFLFNGQGGNGKGFTGAMMGKILGDYYYQAPNTILLELCKPGAANPDLFHCIGKRYINWKEVEGKIKVATLRNLTGGGYFSARLLMQNPTQFEMNATAVMEFNNAPELEGKPQASDYRRLTHIEFPINFSDDPNKIGKVIDGVSYRKANSIYETDDFREKMKPIFLDMLLDVYKKNYTDNVGILYSIPQAVRVKTEKFIEDQNPFQKVLYENYDIVEDETKRIKFSELWSVFQSSEDYRSLNSRRAKADYGRLEFYKWLGKFKIYEDHTYVKYLVGIIRKHLEYQGNENTEEE